MSVLNSILFLFSPYNNAAVAPSGRLQVEPERLKSGVLPGDRDVFEQGQWWKNRSTVSRTLPRNDPAGASCLAAGAYAFQSRVIYYGAAEDAGAPKSVLLEKAGDDGRKEVSSSESSKRASEQSDTRQMNSIGPRKPDGSPLSQAEERLLLQLDHADTDVRAHEMAHLAVVGSYASSGMSLQYQRGPDGKNYAVAGEVKIDTSTESTPEATIAKMEVVRAAALAPADPSPQDRKVAASAAMAISTASQEMRMVELEQAQVEAQRAGQEAAAGSEVGKGRSIGSGGEDPAAGVDANSNSQSARVVSQIKSYVSFSSAGRGKQGSGFGLDLSV